MKKLSERTGISNVEELSRKFTAMAAIAHHAAKEQTDHLETIRFYGRADAFQDAALECHKTANLMLDEVEKMLKEESDRFRAVAEPVKQEPKRPAWWFLAEFFRSKK